MQILMRARTNEQSAPFLLFLPLIVGCRVFFNQLLLPFSFHGFAQQELDLAVDAAQLFTGPTVNLVPQFGADAN